MRKSINFRLLVIFGLVLTLFSCSKDKVEPDDETSYSKPNDRVASAEVDEALDQVNDMISNKIGGGSNMKLAAGATYNLPCGVVSVDSSTTTPGGKTIYKLNYGDKTQCGYKYKSGLISFALTNTSGGFNQAGAVFTITFTDYVVEVNATKTYVKLNGSISVTNVSGNYVWEVINNSSLTVTHTIRGTLDITYYDNTTRQRKYFQRREWSSSTGGTANGWTGLSLTIDGDSIDAANSANHISEVGYTYEFNLPFTTSVSTPLVWSNCGTTWAGPYKLQQGHAKMDVTTGTTTYFDVEAGYYWDYTSGATPVLDNSCQSNAYKITTVIGSTTIVSYQLY